MKSEGQQTDFVEQQRLAQACRIAADFVMHDPHFTEAERAKRRSYYLAQADQWGRLEAHE
jgi:hypothetical protein